MRSTLHAAAAVAITAALGLSSAASPLQKHGGKKHAGAAPVAAPGPAGVGAAAGGNSDASEWSLGVEPYAIFGSGRPGKGAADFDKPDGVAFTPNGFLLATDAKNRRIQVWDVKTKVRIGEFGKKVFGGEIVDIAVAPDGTVYVTDQSLNLAYVFAPPAPGAVNKDSGKPLAPHEYQFKGTRFGEQGFDKLGGILADGKGRVYGVDAHLNLVRRFTPDGQADPTWNFEQKRADGDTYLHGCEGIALDAATGDLYIASEKDSVVEVFDAETGAYRRRMIGAAGGETGKPSGVHVFSGSVEGLALAGKTLFAVDESVGHVQIFDVGNPNVFNTSLDTFRAARKAGRAYLGYVGHSAKVNFEDKTNTSLQQQVDEGSIIPGQANPPGYFCSPDSVATWVDGPETYIAIADQCNFRIAVYRWSDIASSLGASASTGATPAAKGGKGGKKHKN